MEGSNRTGLLKLLAGLVVAALIFVAIWLVFLRGTGEPEADRNTARKTTQNDASKHAGSPPGSRDENQDGGAQSAASGQAAATQLVASGPGDPAALFVVTTLTATIASSIYYKLRARRSEPHI